MTNERRKKIRRGRRKKDKNRIIKWFQGLSKKKKIALISVAVVLLLILITVAIVAWKFSKLDTQKIDEKDIIINQMEDPTVGEGYTNFVLFGGDSRAGDVERNLNTDTIIIASLNNETKEVKLVSVYRDTLLDLTNGRINKCNGAYAAGGPTQAINMLNMNLDLNIMKYVTVNFGAVAELVDMLGGIEADISQAEMNAMNQYVWETGYSTGRAINYITKTGPQTLDGVQATTYARIRKGVGDDYKRTERQRYVIEQVVEKALKSDLATINNIIDKLFPQISTNFTMSEILGYAKSFSKYSIGETTGFPIEKGSATLPGRGSCVFPITLEKNVSLLHEFLYGTEDYQPSSKVVSISGEIASIVGNREVEPNTTWTDNGDGTTGDEGDETNPDGTNPDGTNPDGTNPDGTNPDGTNPDGTNPDGTNPDGTNPDGTNPDGTNPDGTNPDGTNPDGTNPDGTNPDGTNPDGTNPDGTNPDGTNPDGTNPDGTNPDGTGGGNGEQGGTGEQGGNQGGQGATSGNQTPQQ